MAELPRDAPVNALDPQPLAEKRVPEIMDHDKLPDMGRMIGRWPSIARTPSSPATTKAASLGAASRH
jgi:hypothetical protein